MTVQSMSQTQLGRWCHNNYGIIDVMNMSLGKLLEMVRDREAWHATVHVVSELDMTGQVNNSDNHVYFSNLLIYVLILI